jgi:hypothetical protein
MFIVGDGKTHPSSVGATSAVCHISLLRSERFFLAF